MNTASVVARNKVSAALTQAYQLGVTFKSKGHTHPKWARNRRHVDSVGGFGDTYSSTRVEVEEAFELGGEKSAFAGYGADSESEAGVASAAAVMTLGVWTFITRVF